MTRDVNVDLNLITYIYIYIYIYMYMRVYYRIIYIYRVIYARARARTTAYPSTKEEAGANVTLHCKGVNVLMIKHNPGIYVIEQATTPDTWGAARVVNNFQRSFKRAITRIDSRRFSRHAHAFETLSLKPPALLLLLSFYND